jgi:restriction system protein
MTQYNRVMAGAGGIHAAECVKDGFIGVDYQIAQDLTNDLTDNFREFNAKYIPVYLAGHPGKTKIGAGLACGFTWTVAKGLKQGDIVISPDGAGSYHVGEITGGYFYKPGGILPHRRPVAWYPNTIERSAMSDPLRRSTNSTGTCCDITQYATELKALIGGQANPALVASDPTVEDPAVFAPARKGSRRTASSSASPRHRLWAAWATPTWATGASAKATAASRLSCCAPT